MGTRFIETPEISGVRSMFNGVLFVIFFYLGFIKKRKEPKCRMTASGETAPD